MCFKVTFTISTAGPHEITVLAGSRPVTGSPFRVEVSPGPVAAAGCRFYGPGLSAVQLGRDMRMFVQLADAFGNIITDTERLEGSNVEVLPCSFLMPHQPRGQPWSTWDGKNQMRLLRQDLSFLSDCQSVFCVERQAAGFTYIRLCIPSCVIHLGSLNVHWLCRWLSRAQ